MLQPLRLGPIHDAPASQFLPSMLQPLMRAAQRGEDVAPVALAIARGFGFDGFWYAVSLSLQPSQETKVFVYSTWPEPLTRLYDERAYIEVDPRIQDVIGTVLPIVWDQSTYRGRSGVVDAFLDVMQMHGVASGLMCSLRDNRGRVAALAMSSAVPVLDEVGKLNVARNLGDVLMFQPYFHELFVTGVLNQFVPPHLQGRRLSPRELECLKFAAAGIVRRGDRSEAIHQRTHGAKSFRFHAQQARRDQSSAGPLLRVPVGAPGAVATVCVIHLALPSHGDVADRKFFIA